MKLSEDQQKVYEHYKDDLRYPASMFESSFSDDFHEGQALGIEKEIEQTTKAVALKLNQQGATITAVTELSIHAIEYLRLSRFLFKFNEFDGFRWALCCF